MNLRPIIRSATESDLAAINDIYNHYVLHSTCTYQEEPESLEGRTGWFRQRGEKHPVIFADWPKKAWQSEVPSLRLRKLG